MIEIDWGYIQARCLEACDNQTLNYNDPNCDWAEIYACGGEQLYAQMMGWA